MSVVRQFPMTNSPTISLDPIPLLQSPGKFFKIKFFFSLPGEVFLIKKKKKSFYEKFAGRQQ
jgi:hypothetical protein